MTNLDIPKQTDLKAIPKDEILDGVITNLEVKTWDQLTKDETKRKNLKDPNGKCLIVNYEVDGLKRHDNFPFTEKPTTTSRYGRFIVKYGDFEIGQIIKVQFDETGKPTIVLAK